MSGTEEIEKTILSVIEKYVDKEHKSKLSLSSELTGDLQMDSLSQMELLMELDEVLGTETDQEVAQTLKSVQDIIEYARKQKS